MLGLWGVGISSGHTKVQPSQAYAAGQGLAPLVKGWAGGQLCWFDPSVDLSAWYNSLATESNLIPSSGLLHASLLAHPGNKRKAVEVVAENAFFCESKQSSMGSDASSDFSHTEVPQSFESGSLDDFEEITSGDKELPF